MLLSSGQKGNRYMMPHATAMLHQPRIPSTGQRQAIEARPRKTIPLPQPSRASLHWVSASPHLRAHPQPASCCPLPSSPLQVYIRWREVLAQKKEMIDILHKHTGQARDKLDKDMQRPLYMQPLDALDYGVIDKVLPPTDKNKKTGADVRISADVKGADAWDKDAGLVKQAAPPRN